MIDFKCRPMKFVFPLCPQNFWARTAPEFSAVGRFQCWWCHLALSCAIDFNSLQLSLVCHNPVKHFHPRLSPCSSAFDFPFHTEFPLSTWPIQFLCLFRIVSISDLCSPTIVSTWSFVICSVQLIFSVFRQIHTSNASSLLMSSFLTVHVSDAYRAKNILYWLSNITFSILKCQISQTLISYLYRLPRILRICIHVQHIHITNNVPFHHQIKFFTAVLKYFTNY